jgi:uncharacterized membrane protein YheB (UPF0754 family)
MKKIVVLAALCFAAVTVEADSKTLTSDSMEEIVSDLITAALNDEHFMQILSFVLEHKDKMRTLVLKVEDPLRTLKRKLTEDFSRDDSTKLKEAVQNLFKNSLLVPLEKLQKRIAEIVTTKIDENESMGAIKSLILHR